MTAVDLLSGAIEQYVGDQEPPSTQQNPETTDDDVRRWKRVKLDLLCKHTVPTPSRSHEIQQFWCLSVSPDNILMWWCQISRILREIPYFRPFLPPPGGKLPGRTNLPYSVSQIVAPLRSPVFYGRSRISDPFSRIPGGNCREEQISRILLVRLSRHSDDTVTRENFV